MKNYKLQFLIIALALVLSYLAITFFTVTAKRNKINKEFPTLLSKDSVNHVVTELFEFEGFAYTPTMVYIKMDDGRIFKIYSHLNERYSNKGIKQILDNGDKIFKKSFSDSLWIIKKHSDKSYLFIIEDKLPFER